MTRRVYLHVGLPKTGTSTIQSSLWESRSRLRDLGVDVPGARRLSQRYAVWDLLGRRMQGAAHQQVPGSWTRLADDIRASPLEISLVSEELLVHARPRHVRRIVRELAPADVHVVVTVRSLTALLGSMWQQQVLGGATWTWQEYTRAVANPEEGSATAGVGFWLRHDVERVLANWGTSVPPDRTHIVVVPGPDRSRGLLLDRYSAAVGVASSTLAVPDRLVNAAMGPVGTELLRRLNARVGHSITEQQRLQLVNGALRPALRSSGYPAALRLPDDVRGAIADRSQHLVTMLRTAPQHVYGDLDDLLPAPERVGVDPEQIGEVELLDAAIAALSAVCGFKMRPVKSRSAGGGSRPGLVTRLGSSSRALLSKAQTSALERADSNRGLAWASRRYLRRRSGR
jgi:hypothetical protein